MNRNVKKRKSWLNLAAGVLLAILILSFCVPALTALQRRLGLAAKPIAAASTAPEHNTAVYFIDVGQGDATLIEHQGRFCLVDTGPPEAEGKLMDFLEEASVKSLDMMVLTHPHQDHIGNALALLEKYPIEMVLITDVNKCSAELSYTMRRLESEMQKSGQVYRVAQPGEEYAMGTGRLNVIGNGIECEDYNDTSLIIRFEAPELTLLCTGDAEAEEEKDALKSKMTLQSDLYQMGHHGASKATSSDLLQAVLPKIAVASCAKGNMYGHPHDSAIQRVYEVGADFYRTDLQGSIAVFAVDGGYTVVTEKTAVDDLAA